MTSPVSTTSRPVPPGGDRSSKIVSLPVRGPSAPSPVKLTSTVHDSPDASVTPQVRGIQPKPALVSPVIVVWETVSVEGPLFVIVIVCGGDGTPSFGRAPKSMDDGLIVTVRKSAVALYGAAPNNAGSPPLQCCSKRAEKVSRLPATFVVISSTTKRPEKLVQTLPSAVTVIRG